MFEQTSSIDFMMNVEIMAMEASEVS
jgi:hypothetical protein